MKKLRAIDYVIYTIWIGAIIAIDQISKALAVKYLQPIDTVPIINGALHLTYAENRGAAFGMLADHRWVFMTISILAISGFIFALYAGFVKPGVNATSITFCLFIGGGIGNMIDRIALGYVVDFIDFRLIDFAIFNLADSAVCIGAALMLLSLIIDAVNEHKAEKGKLDKDQENG